MAAIGLIAIALGGLMLRVRSVNASRETARHAKDEVEWTRRRDMYRDTLANMRSRGPVLNFYFHSVSYESPEAWQQAMEEVIA
jgi:hypothetical protein